MTHVTFPKPPRRERKPRKPIKRSTKPIARRKRPNRVSMSPAATAERKADAEWAAPARTGRCEALGAIYHVPFAIVGGDHGIADIVHRVCEGPMDAAHGFPRTYKATRHDPKNRFVICRFMHRYWTRHPTEWTEFMIEKLGEVEYQRLRNKALAGGKA